MNIDVKFIENKWQTYWEKNNVNKINVDNINNKYYCLEMFAYPSGAMLHLGHWYNYTPSDTFARFKRMQGYNVFQPIGYDAFGLPAENYAIKTGIHPNVSTHNNIDNMREAIKRMGIMCDYNYEIRTCEENYYKWTQWLFLKLYEHKLAYRKNAPVNWCEKCKTVLANEQVINNQCERCGTEIIRRNLTQWFLNITKYADSLLSGLNKLDWPNKTKIMQSNWIGESKGLQISFKCLNNNTTIDVFTTRPDTIYGVSYLAISPDNQILNNIVTNEYKDIVEEYKYQTSLKNEIERLAINKTKTGVFTGQYAINPCTNKIIPIYVADYVLSTYGTGAVIGVPAHDERDYIFASNLNIEIIQVITNKDNNCQLPYIGDGVLINSDIFNGINNNEAKNKISEYLINLGCAKYHIYYRLRDWLVSRQRYWGSPIPIVYCEKCGIVPVKYEDLPVKLPYNVDFKPSGESPLALCEEFVNTKCPQCGNNAKREVDTLDTFVCSSWYYLRYPSANNDKEPFNIELINKILPIDKYIGGAEHACMHLLYARFITKFLHDIGYINFDEPFLSLIHQGLILGTDGSKMSKSKGNFVNPSVYVDKYGADILRLYLMFGFSYKEGGAWDENGIKAIEKFVNRIFEYINNLMLFIKQNKVNNIQNEIQKLEYQINYAIKNITNDLENFSFNTCIARLMECLNIFESIEINKDNINNLYKNIQIYIKLFAPFAPHLAEELWEMVGNKQSIFYEKYPVCNMEKLNVDTVEIVIQINSKIKDKILIKNNTNDEEIKNIVLNNDKIQKLINNKTIKNIFIIKNKLVNIVI